MLRKNEIKKLAEIEKVYYMKPVIKLVKRFVVLKTNKKEAWKEVF